MATKFFTWTKGDRKIAAEWLHAEPLTLRPQKCPPKQALDVQSDLTASYSPASAQQKIPAGDPHASSRSASYPVATIAGLKECPLSARPENQIWSLQVPPGRPRSRTAPTTPACDERPHQPAELPGSMPLLVPQQERWLSDGIPSAVVPEGLRPSEMSSRLRANSPCTPRGETCSVGPSPARCTPLCVQPQRLIELTPQSHTPMNSGPPSAFHITPHRPTAHFGALIEPGSSQVSIVQQDDMEAILLQQISTLRATHDSHLASLKDAHDKEIATHLSYITFLERRHSSNRAMSSLGSAPLDPQPFRGLTIDTTNAVLPLCELPALETSATTLQSSEPSWSDTRPSSHESILELEALKRQLSSARREQTRSARASQQCEQLRDSLEQRERRILQLKETVKHAKENELTLRNAVERLEAKLASANNERLDVLEGFYDVCRQLDQKLAERTPSSKPSGDTPATDLPAVTRSTFKQSNPPESGSGMQNEEACKKSKDTLRVATLEAEAQALTSERQTKDNVIAELRSKQQVRHDSDAHNSARFFELQARLEKQASELKRAKADRDSYNFLLHSELRRQSKVVADQAHNVSPSVRTRASVQLQSIITDATFTADGSVEGEGGLALAKLLEKQLEHCLQENILYKLDVRKLRKDLKKTHSDLSALQLITSPSPPTPDRDTSQHSRLSTPESRSRARKRNDAVQDGLGITMVSPPRATSRARIEDDVVSPNGRSMQRSTTPLSTHKELPKPPVSNSPDVPQHKRPSILVQRAETTRSLSDSIISSYAQRATPGQDELAAVDAAFVGAPVQLTVV